VKSRPQALNPKKKTDTLKSLQRGANRVKIKFH